MTKIKIFTSFDPVVLQTQINDFIEKDVMQLQSVVMSQCEYNKAVRYTVLIQYTTMNNDVIPNQIL